MLCIRATNWFSVAAPCQNWICANSQFPDAPPAPAPIWITLFAEALLVVVAMDVPSAIVEIQTPERSLGTWLVSEYIERPQQFTYNNRTYKLELRPRRYYSPFSFRLLAFQHDVYPGTDIPKNFSSRVQLQHLSTGGRVGRVLQCMGEIRPSGC